MAPKLLGRKLELLRGAESRQLFRQCAGREAATDAGPAGLEGEVISACGGLPLALELAGGFLFQKDNAHIWQVWSRPPAGACVSIGQLQVLDLGWCPLSSIHFRQLSLARRQRLCSTRNTHAPHPPAQRQPAPVRSRSPRATRKIICLSVPRNHGIA